MHRHSGSQPPWLKSDVDEPGSIHTCDMLLGCSLFFVIWFSTFRSDVEATGYSDVGQDSLRRNV